MITYYNYEKLVAVAEVLRQLELRGIVVSSTPLYASVTNELNTSFCGKESRIMSLRMAIDKLYKLAVRLGYTVRFNAPESLVSIDSRIIAIQESGN